MGVLEKVITSQLFTSTGIPKWPFGDPCHGEATLPRCPTASPGVFMETLAATY